MAIREIQILFMAATCVGLCSCTIGARQSAKLAPISNARPGATQLPADVQVSSSLDTVLRAIFKYMSTHEQAPGSIEELVSAGYLKTEPINPYTKQAMVNVRLGAANKLGNYTYMVGTTIIHKEGSADHKVRSTFLLIGYGKQADRVRDFAAWPAGTRKFMTDIVRFDGNAGCPSPNFGRQWPRMSMQYASDAQLLKENGYD